jgi:enoyl-CoA hydratase/carnithine racemase
VTDDLVLADRPADGVAVLTLNRPAKLNALNKALLGRLASTVDALAAEPGLRAVVLTGAGTAFCAGPTRWPPSGRRPPAAGWR